MEHILKSEKSLMRLEHIRKFLLSEKWMAVLFVIAGAFACLHSFFPNGSIQIWGTVVLAYITGIVFGNAHSGYVHVLYCHTVL